MVVFFKKKLVNYNLINQKEEFMRLKLNSSNCVLGSHNLYDLGNKFNTQNEKSRYMPES